MLLSILVVILAWIVSDAGAQPACFAVKGELVTYDGAHARQSMVRLGAGGQGAVKYVKDVWGAMPDGRVVATLSATSEPLDLGIENSGATKPAGGDLVLTGAGGAADAVVAHDVLRAFPGKSGNSIAMITTARDLLIWRGGTVTTVTLGARISTAAWSPDDKGLVLVAYPNDWSPRAVDNAKTTAEFLRLQHSSLVWLDAGDLATTRPIKTPAGTNYNPFFSPDGGTLYYIWLHPVLDEGGLMRQTGFDAEPRKLTSAGEKPGQVPLGRVGTYLWTSGQNGLLFEAGKPDGSGVLWTMTSDGGNARTVATGRHPQALPDGRVAYLDEKGQPATLDSIFAAGKR